MGFKNINEPIYNLFGEEVVFESDVILNKRFGVPPFSTFDTKSGYWQNRKRDWLSLGIKSELGRDAKSFGWEGTKYEERNFGCDTSVFDPVVCELCYNWFLPKNSKKILDCFAGGSVRGIVAGKLGYDYLGFDLSERQIDANILNADEVLSDEERNRVVWVNDDSMNIDNHIKDETFDLLFSCPPYFDLEVYSDKPNDLSNMSWNKFAETYQKIIEICVRKLKPNRFAVFVVGDIRDKDGYYRDFCDLTKTCFKNAGMKTYNEIILLNPIGSAMIRASIPFNTNRKVTKVHQNILVFYKGDIKQIRNEFESFDE